MVDNVEVKNRKYHPNGLPCPIQCDFCDSPSDWEDCPKFRKAPVDRYGEVR